MTLSFAKTLSSACTSPQRAQELTHHRSATTARGLPFRRRRPRPTKGSTFTPLPSPTGTRLLEARTSSRVIRQLVNLIHLHLSPSAYSQILIIIGTSNNNNNSGTATAAAAAGSGTGISQVDIDDAQNGGLTVASNPTSNNSIGLDIECVVFSSPLCRWN